MAIEMELISITLNPQVMNVYPGGFSISLKYLDHLFQHFRIRFIHQSPYRTPQQRISVVQNIRTKQNRQYNIHQLKAGKIKNQQSGSKSESAEGIGNKVFPFRHQR